MVVAHYTHSKERIFARKAATTFAVLLGIFTLFFTATPQNTVHADTPHTPDTPCDSSTTNCEFETGAAQSAADAAYSAAVESFFAAIMADAGMDTGGPIGE